MVIEGVTVSRHGDDAWQEAPDSADADPFGPGTEERDTIEPPWPPCFYCGVADDVPVHRHDAGNGTAEFFHGECHTEMVEAGECDDDTEPS